MAIGEKNNTWGTTANVNFGTLIEKSIAGTASIDITGGDVTLSAYQGSDDQARCHIILIGGAPGAHVRNVIAPAVSKSYIVINANASGTDAVFKSPLTAGVTLLAGEYVALVWNGNDFQRVGLSSVSPAFSGTPTAPTPAVDDNSTAIATTGYVMAQGYPKAVDGGGNHPASGLWPINITGSAAQLGGYAASTYLGGLSPSIEGVDINDAAYDKNMIATWAPANAPVTNGPVGAPNHGTFLVFNGGWITQMIIGSHTADTCIWVRNRWYNNSWVSQGSVWVKIGGLTTNGNGNRAISTAAASGTPADGDIWYQYTP
jgi:hypothetical protein